MLLWVLAAVAGMAIAVVAYGWRDPRGTPERALPVLLRGAALTALIAALLDAPAGRARRPGVLVALDVSSSWHRASGDSAWRSALDRARRVGADSLLLFGDSARIGEPPDAATDAASRARPMVARALAAGRPVVVITDGVIEDPDELSALPAGSRIEALSPTRGPDLALVALEMPRTHMRGDTLEARVTIATGAAGLPGGRIVLRAADVTVAEAVLDSAAADAERTYTLRAPIRAADGPLVVSAALTAPDDVEPANDTLSAVIDVSEAAGAVFVSTAPDLDARFAIGVLRGTLSLPTRAYYRVAPGQWRVDGSLAPATEADIRRAVRSAPLVVLHGDTAVFGAPLQATQGALALIPPVVERGDWYAVAAPASPLAMALSGVSWDSLPPVDVAPRLPAGVWQGLETRRARQFERRPAIVGLERPRRQVIVGAAGLWRWHFRGGAGAEAYAALWGSIFDWLLEDRSSPSAVSAADPLLRAGEPMRWRRGPGADSVVRMSLARRGDAAGADSVMLRFPEGVSVIETRPLRPGVYDVGFAGGSAVLAVNSSREWLPAPATVSTGDIGDAPAAGDAPGVRQMPLVYIVALALLCAEWIVRRRRGWR